MANLQKCPNGHFYNADTFPECPYCPAQPRQQADPNKTVPLRSDPLDPGKTAPLQNGQWGAFPDPNKTAPAQNWQQPAQAGPVNKLTGPLAKAGGWRRLLAIVAAVVMLIYTVGTFSEGSRDLSEDDYDFWGNDFVEMKHQSGTYELLSSAGAAALCVCAVYMLKTKGQKPPLAASVISAAVVVAGAYLWMNSSNTYFTTMYGYRSRGLGDFAFYMLPPLLSLLALYLYQSERKTAA